MDPSNQRLAILIRKVLLPLTLFSTCMLLAQLPFAQRSIPDPRLLEAIANMARCDPEELSQQALRKVVVLNLNAAGVESLTGIRFVRNLEAVELGNLPFDRPRPPGRRTSLNSIADLRPLVRLPRLHTLTMYNALATTDLGPLASMRRLRTLDFSYSPASRGEESLDLSPLAHLRELETLILCGNHLNRSESFARGTWAHNHPRLTYLDLRDNGLTSADWLEILATSRPPGAPPLTVDLRGNPIEVALRGDHARWLGRGIRLEPVATLPQ